MNTTSNTNRSHKEVAPFLHVSSMEQSVSYYLGRPRIHDEAQLGRRRKAALVLAFHWTCFANAAGIPQGGA